MGKEQDAALLREHYGEYYPQSPEEARVRLDRDGSDLPAPVYLALTNLLIENMGNKTSKKKKDRQKGQKLRKNRTGSRRG
jgi:hypothetical protein